MIKINMKNYGLNDKFINESHLYEELTIGRVVSQEKGLYKVVTEKGEIKSQISGKFRYISTRVSDFPAVGDFVMVDENNNSGIIHHVLTRKSMFIRKAAGTSNDNQIVAANIDIAFICMALNNDFNLRRLERYIGVAWDSGATPVVVLTKSDLCNNLEEILSELETVALSVDILVTSSITEDGFTKISKYIEEGKTVAFMGSSGVGKTTLINKLAGENLFETQETRNDDRGRHTTTRRELIVLPSGGIVIDTPGMRELGIESADLSKTFADIKELSKNCRFNDCSHTKEPGCAVREAIKNGSLSESRLSSYEKLTKEAKYDGLSSKQIEEKKLHEMFKEVGGMKNARKYIKNKKKYD